MGHSTANCMVSRLPIPSGTKTVAFFVTPNTSSRGSSFANGNSPYDKFQFISWPMFFTMDDYPGSIFQSYENELVKQIAWKVFIPQIKTRNEYENEHEDWFRFSFTLGSGIWNNSINISGKSPKDHYNDCLIPIGLSFVRKDVWDWCIKNTKDSLSFDHIDDTFNEWCSFLEMDDASRKEALEKNMFKFSWNSYRKLNPDIIHFSQMPILNNGSLEKEFNGKTIIDIKVTKQEREELKNLTTKMVQLVDSMIYAGAFIHPSMNTSPQDGWHERDFKLKSLSWLNFLSKTAKNDTRKTWV